MNKKHFIILGRVGLVYYSWLLIVLLISLIMLYEGTPSLNWPAIIWGSLFLLLTGYTLINSYWNKQGLKLPYKAKMSSKVEPELIHCWSFFRIYRIQVDSLEKYHLLRIEYKG
ncbi:acyltransferase [Lactobacillus xylocopicola]|uniref:Acyltransferase n=1 Tax=Lactobacillus xylocopicola TaxID=2976676 RepID=A0ABN6SK01_9LACO|nr:acyltransferase [Lactobacillus xylocopicola]BDR60499.1 hypothetical protein KIM322_07600 [Lactobacillus xylocopicola]